MGDVTARDVLDGIKARLRDAADGPWRWAGPDMARRVLLNAGDETVLQCSALMWPDRYDAVFIAAAPTDVARLTVAVDAVLALAEEWRYKGENGWGAWQEGQGPDPEGYVLDTAAGELRAAIENALKESQ
jgi:hypothetical protein